MALNITITDAGRAEIINANNTGTAPVTLTHIGFTAAAFTPNAGLTALPSEIKRVSSIAGEIVAPDTISVTAKDEGQDTYTMRGFGIFTGSGTLFAVYGQVDPIIEKSSGSTMLLTIDVVLADIDAASLEFGDISFSNPPASLTTPGVVTLSNATDSTAQHQAATPRAVKSANDNANTRLAKSQNLADLTSAATARVNLGLGASATLGNTALRTSASTTLLLQAAAMNDHRTSGDHDDRYPQRGNNLSDLPSPSQARSNLGLGASATMGTTASRTSSSTATVLQAKAMNDHRQSDDHDGRYPLKEEVFPATVQIEDWNDTPNVNCFLRALGGNTPNKPPNTAGTYGWQLCSSAEGTYKQQFCSNLADHSVYTRAFINGVWHTWYPIFHGGNQFALGVSAESAREALQLGSSARLNAGEATGDVMLVGAFGVGNDGNINVPDNNANTITRSGVYRAYSATVGMPYTALWQLQHWVQGSNVAVQIAMESGSSLSSRAFMRTCNTEREWSPWQQLLTDRDTQQSPDDQTVGRLLTVGAFGLGSPGLLISDWNDTPNVTCFLRATSGATPNRPPNTSGTYGWQLVSSDAGSYKQQFCANLADNAIYTRSYINGTWQAWQTLFHTGNLTPVETSRTLSAGDGLIGGGNLSANRTITLGTPGTLSGSTPNNASGSTHTHQLNIASTALAQAGNNDSALMTPIKTHAAFNQYGLGIDTAPRIADDLNNYYPSGLYYAFSAANSPGNGYVLYQHYSSDFASQLWISASSSRTCVRRKISGTWRNWEEIYTDANISPVDISRTINTGDGLTGGGNLSGNRTLSVDSSVARTDQFIRSGTQAGGQTISGDLRFQWGQATISASGDAQWVNFPNAFANACTSIVANHIGSGPAFVTIGNRERGRFEARVRRTDGVTSGALVICYIAMGY